jgi:hypothetical protein
MKEEVKFKYELPASVVNYVLGALNRNQIAGVEQAKDLLSVVELLQNPLNKDDIEKEQYESLKGKFEKK